MLDQGLLKLLLHYFSDILDHLGEVLVRVVVVELLHRIHIVEKHLLGRPEVVEKLFLEKVLVHAVPVILGLLGVLLVGLPGGVLLAWPGGIFLQAGDLLHELLENVRLVRQEEVEVGVVRVLGLEVIILVRWSMRRVVVS